MHGEISERNGTEPHQQGVDKVLAALGVNPQSGLSREEARTRLSRYGKNELVTEKPVPEWQRFLGQFRDILVILLLAAGLVSAGLWMFERDTALPYEAIQLHHRAY
jgi:Ca2+-transporting ATPase